MISTWASSMDARNRRLGAATSSPAGGSHVPPDAAAVEGNVLQRERPTHVGASTRTEHLRFVFLKRFAWAHYTHAPGGTERPSSSRLKRALPSCESNERLSPPGTELTGAWLRVTTTLRVVLGERRFHFKKYPIKYLTLRIQSPQKCMPQPCAVEPTLWCR